MGYKTPNIDRLALEGMRYTNFYAAQPISGASRAGLLTGCYPNRIGFAHAPNPGCPYGISDEEETIAEVLKERFRKDAERRRALKQAEIQEKERSQKLSQLVEKFGKHR